MKLHNTGSNLFFKVFPLGFGRNREIFVDLLIIASVWIGLIFIVDPTGEFPLNDDWLYAKSVLILITNSHIKLMDYISMTLLSNIIWGALFCKLFGFSFLTLRVSNLVISYIGIGIFYVILRLFGLKRLVAYLFTGILAFNPIFFSISYTFMTDNFFLTVILLSFLFFVFYLKYDSNYYLIPAIFFSVVATLSRQIGLFLPLGFGLAVLFFGGLNLRKSIRAFLPFFISLFFLISYYLFLNEYSRVPQSSDYHTGIIANTLENPLSIAKSITKNFLSSIYRIGFFLLPLLPFLIRYLYRLIGKRKINLIITSLVLIPSIFSLFYYIDKLPLFWNSIHSGGIGPITLNNFESLPNSHYSTLPNSFWLVVSFLSILNGSILFSYFVTSFFERIRDFNSFRLNKQNIFIIFPAFSIIIYWLLFSLTYFFDRYLVIFIPFFIILIIILWGDINSLIKTHSKILMALILVFFLGFSVLGTIDYLNWNRIRWNALSELTFIDGISPLKINGGYEFNGWYCYYVNTEDDSEKTRWLVQEDEYIVSFDEKKKYNIYKAYKYQRLLPFHSDTFFILKRKTLQQQ
ncbi:MAG: hypothetical protein HW421_145 [Ignavibacteria bacterium]|nr:hypothetical protein [Ignavibacteria bacterium]